MCQKHYISQLSPGDIVDARVTHLETFGAFCDIGCGCVSLLPIDTISVSRISHPKDRFHCGDDIKAIIKSIEDGKITLSQKELLGTWEQNAAEFEIGQTVTGIIRSVESYGVFIELAPNLAGLAEVRGEMQISQLRQMIGKPVAVYIKSIVPDRMKIKLVLIDAEGCMPTPKKITYYVDPTVSHISRWVYSPLGAQKRIETSFDAI
jgi:small subunit ribosomal protein S1